MARSTRSAFGILSDFQSALRPDGVAGLVVTEHGRFRARVTQVVLHFVRIAAVQETFQRIAFLVAPADVVIILLSQSEDQSQLERNEILILGPGESIHMRSDGSCSWICVQIPVQMLARYCYLLSEKKFEFSSVRYWKLRHRSMRRLRSLLRTAAVVGEASSLSLVDADAARGLEQQLVEALIDCLETAELQRMPHADPRCRELLAQFEAFLRHEPLPRVADICAALGISRLMLSTCCRNTLGLGADRYRLLSGLQLVHEALRSGDPAVPTVAAAVQRYGFDRMAHFAAHYREVYGELPSATLRGAVAVRNTGRALFDKTPD